MADPLPHRRPPPAPAGDEGKRSPDLDGRAPLGEMDEESPAHDVSRVSSDLESKVDVLQSDETDQQRSYDIIRWFIAHFLSVPAKEREQGASFDAFISKKFVSVGFSDDAECKYTVITESEHGPTILLKTESEIGPTILQKFLIWVMDNAELDYSNESVIILLHRFGFKVQHPDDPIELGSGIMGSRLHPTLQQFIRNMKPLQEQVPRIRNALSSIDLSLAEGVKVLGEIRDTASRAESLFMDTIKKVEAAEAKGATKEGESVILGFVEELKKLEDSDIGKFLKQIDSLSQMSNIPLDVKKRLQGLVTELKRLKFLIPGATAGWSISTNIIVPGVKDHEKEESGKEEPLAPAVVEVPMPPLIPFYQLGKAARDVLYKDFLGDAPYHCGVHSFFVNKHNPSFSVKLRSAAPNVSVVMKQEQLFGSPVNGSIKLALPFRNRFKEENGIVEHPLKEYPMKEMSKATLVYLNERACLSATLGLHANPALDLGALFGAPKRFLGCSLAGGGRLRFNTTAGAVVGLEAGAVVGLEAGFVISNDSWGNLSTTARLLKKDRGLTVLYHQKLLEKNTLAVEVDYNDEKQAVVASVGLEHDHSRSMRLKASIKTDGCVQAMIESEEGFAGMKVRGCVKVDMRNLDQPPRVGFSVCCKPTW